MTIDALALAALRSEAIDKLQGCRIQKIIPTGPLSLVLEVYNPERRARVQFLMSADAQNARFHLLEQKASQRPGEPTPFLLLLRKYVRYGIIVNIEQLPFERIILLTIEKKFPAGKKPRFDVAGAVVRAAEPDTAEDSDDGDDEAGEDFELYESKLVCEIMGRHSNIMLLSEEGVIIDAIKRVPPSKNRYRLILPHQTYVAPPPQEKQAFHLESPASFTRLMQTFAEKQPEALLWQILVSTFSGVGPQLGKELAYRWSEARGSNTIEVKLKEFQRWEGLYTELRNLLKPLNPHYEPGEERPVASIVHDDNGRAVAFAPYVIHQFRERDLEPEVSESISKVTEEFYSQSDSVTGQAQRKAQIAQNINEHQEKLRRRASSLEGSLKKAEAADELRQKGDAIYANLWLIEPGQKELKVDNLTVTLNPDLKPAENAQQYFREYDKARQALSGVPELLEETRYEMSYLDEMLTALELAENFEEVMNIKAELAENGYAENVSEKDAGKVKSTRPKRRKLPQTPTFTSAEGFTIYVGKSALHNDYVTFELGERQDYWLHARGVPGSHVIIKTTGREVPDATLEMAAALAAYYSKARQDTKVEVIYALQRYVRKVKGPHPGLVTYSQEFGSINVRPNSFARKK